jgi:hypothetical protein
MRSGMSATLRTVPSLALVISAIVPEVLEAQRRQDAGSGRDTIIAAHKEYDAGGLHRFFLGDNYRDLWTTAIRVPFLDLQTYAGGLKAYKTGGGQATKTLRLLGPDSAQFVFRPIYKSVIELPDYFRNTIIWKVVDDQRSAWHPAGPLAAPALLDAVRILHPRPQLFVMPDDPSLGEFRKEFAGVLGTMEEFPDTPEKGVAFAGAVKIINNDDLLIRINTDPRERFDARAFLTAHLIDMLLGDSDRHGGQWKLARLKPDAEWVHIPRDRDYVFLSYEGFVAATMRKFVPSLLHFDSTYANASARFSNALEFDRRLLAGLEKPVWDSIAASVTRAITDSVLRASVAGMPPEYAASSAEILGKLQARRDHLGDAATEYYLYLSKVVDLHATDTADRATITRSGNGFVDVRIQLGNNPPWFSRRFDARETDEIRLYLHDGNDTAVVNGRVAGSIPVRLIGGNGNNTLIDSSIVGGKSNPTYIYDTGNVTGVLYQSDSVIKAMAEAGRDEDLPYNRVPWRRLYGMVRPPERDRGSSMKPVIGLGTGHGLGLVPRIGIAKYSYGFRRDPYSSLLKGELAYSTTNRAEAIVAMDKRFESTGFHVPVSARMSQLGVVEFRGFGNDVANLRGRFHEVRQREWRFQPAVGLSFGPESDVTIGPILRYTTTDSVANRFIARERPYGFESFGQAGIRLDLHHDTRNEVDTVRRRLGGIVLSPPQDPPLWGTVDFSASAYPSMWDVVSSYQDLSAGAAAYLTLPVLTRPILALRAGGQKLFGNFPYFDAAFLGGSRSLRTENYQRYAGDAMVFGTTELRVPIAKFPFILPLDVGALGFVDIGRVYLDGESPGGWHKGAGAGLWVGVINPGTGINVTITNNPDRRVLTHLGFVF